MDIRKIAIKGLFGEIDHEIDLSDSITILMGDNGVGKTAVLRIINAIFDKDFIKYMIEWSRKKVSNVPLQTEAEQLMAAEDIANYDEWKFLNGHDMTLILYILLKNKVKISISNEEDFERSLYVAYEKSSLEQTALYASILKFAQDNNIVIFK